MHKYENFVCNHKTLRRNLVSVVKALKRAFELKSSELVVVASIYFRFSFCLSPFPAILVSSSSFDDRGMIRVFLSKTLSVL